MVGLMQNKVQNVMRYIVRRCAREKRRHFKQTSEFEPHPEGWGFRRVAYNPRNPRRLVTPKPLA